MSSQAKDKIDLRQEYSWADKKQNLPDLLYTMGSL